MKASARCLLIALFHVLIVCSLMGKFYYDRVSRPRVWVRSAPIDPDLPIRGRYVALDIEVEPKGDSESLGRYYQPGRLEVNDGKLFFIPDPNGSVSVFSDRGFQAVDGTRLRLRESVPFFIPENVPDPSIRKPGEELWVEVTIPKKGPPRPIRLGVKPQGDGEIRPLDLD